MPRILGGEVLAFKDMPEVATACGADNLYAASIGIGYASDRTVNLIVKAWPTATRIEFII